MRRTLIALALLLVACRPSEVKRTGSDSGTTTTTTVPVAVTVPATPLTFTGAGQTNTDPFTLAGGDYIVAYDFGGECFYGVTFELTSKTGIAAQVASGSGPVAGSSNLYAVDGGAYFLHVITGPPPGCPWSIILTSR